jgi:hypothetical protein
MADKSLKLAGFLYRLARPGGSKGRVENAELRDWLARFGEEFAN